MTKTMKGFVFPFLFCLLSFMACSCSEDSNMNEQDSDNILCEEVVAFAEKQLGYMVSAVDSMNRDCSDYLMPVSETDNRLSGGGLLIGGQAFSRGCCGRCII